MSKKLKCHNEQFNFPLPECAVDLLQNILNYEIAVELLREYDPDISQDMIDVIWELCKGRPFDACPLYEIIKLHDDMIDETQNETL